MIFALAVLAMLAGASDASASCPQWSRPLAPTKDVATAIAEAVLAGQPPRKGPRIPAFRLEVADAGDFWRASESPVLAPGAPPMKGGGGMSFSIRKCDGAIRDIAFQE